MAIFNKINQHSGVVVGIVAVGLVLFLVGGEVFGPNSYFRNRSKNVGEIAGKSVSAEDFQKKVDETEADYVLRTGRSVGESERPSIIEQAWNAKIFDIAYAKQFEKLGLTVTNDELYDMVQGEHIHPTVIQLFSNPQTQQFDKAFLKEFFNKFKERDPRDQQLWYSIERGIKEERLRTKYLNLFRKSVYVTSEEAKRDYNSQNTKAEAKYLYVPFYAVADSLVKVTDDMLSDYLNKHKNEFKVDAGRSFDYVTFSVKPSAEDSAAFKQELAEVKQEFASSQNDTLFIQTNSDNPVPPSFKTFGELPEELKNIANNVVIDSIYGPFITAGKVQLYKINDIKSDSVSYAKASHILFDTRNKSAAEKDSLKKKANEVLNQIKSGADFAQMARMYGSDGTASRGGDLGWFSQGQMVKPFSDAVFQASSAGLLPKLTETEFGYHIIKVTAPKNNKKYLVALVEKDIIASEATKDAAFRKADEFANSIKDTADFNAKVKADSLQKFSAANIRKADRYVNNLSNGRAIVRWAFNDADVNDVSSVFSLDDQYVVAILTGEREEGIASVNDVKDELTAKVRNEEKGKLITEKLSKLSGSFEKIAAEFGSGATSGAAPDVTLASNSIAAIGYDPVAVGKLFGLKKGSQTGPFKGEYGVINLELVNLTPAPEIADYSKYKNDIINQRIGRVDYSVDEAIRKNSDIVDERVKFF